MIGADVDVVDMHPELAAARRVIALATDNDRLQRLQAEALRLAPLGSAAVALHCTYLKPDGAGTAEIQNRRPYLARRSAALFALVCRVRGNGSPSVKALKRC